MIIRSFAFRLVQNEPGIQEVWDTVRRVRCLWEGNINKALTVNFSVDMLNQEIVTFSGDTATARLDIQVGRGPFAPAADGLVKIGETMTLVVTVEGDPGFDLQVRRSIKFLNRSPSLSLVLLSTILPPRWACKLSGPRLSRSRRIIRQHDTTDRRKRMHTETKVIRGVPKDERHR